MIKLQACQSALMTLLIIFLLPLPASAADEESPLLNTFKQRYDQVREQVKQGTLPDTTGNQAQDLWLSLRQDMIYLDARIEAYKLETQETSDARQREALQHLVDVSAERERLLLNAIQALDELVQGKKTDIPISTARPQTTPPAGGDAQSQSKGSISITLEPEDLSAPSWE